jgi:predicted negative regulator of RcsB-dependent stress response
MPGETTFPTAAQRAKAANQKFQAVASQYGWLRAGKNARYFAGLTAIDMGQTGQAEGDLQAVANSSDRDLAALAKVALAGLYQQTNRPDLAISLYRQLIAKPTTTVPASAAQLQLAALYETKNPAEAKRIYAQLKNDKGAAGQIAAQKLAQP